MALRNDRVALLKNVSMMLSQEPWVGVKMKEKRFGTEARYLFVSLEM
jgi:hypothetical protein